VRFQIKAQLAARAIRRRSDSAWPDDRKVSHLGTLTISRTVADSHALQKSWPFYSGRLTDGIEPSMTADRGPHGSYAYLSSDEARPCHR